MIFASGRRSGWKEALRAYTFFKFINLVVAFGFQIVLAKSLSPAHFATYAIWLAALVAGERAFSLGVDRTILRFVPTLYRHQDIRALRAVIGRVVALRLSGLMAAGAFWFACVGWLDSIAPMPLKPAALVAVAAWFVSYTLTSDLDALGQACLAHFVSASTATLESVARLTGLIILVKYQAPAIDDIVMLCAGTSTVALFLAIYRLRHILLPLSGWGRESASGNRSSLSSKQALQFALGNYASNISYLISSPQVIRIVASTGLGVIELAAYSFAQGLYVSFQRVLPGLMVLPILDPLFMSNVNDEVPESRVYAALSLLFKVELICVLCLAILTTIAGSDIIKLLAIPAYAQHNYILTILISSILLGTAYRVLELIANRHFMQHTFYWLWPLSLVAMLALSATVQSWGLWTVLFWPVVEGVVRIAFLSVLLRRYQVWKAFDPKSAMLTASTAVGIVSGMLIAAPILPPGPQYLDFILAFVGIVLFLVSLFFSRPLRSAEYLVLSAALPESLGMVRRIASRLAEKKASTS